MSSKACLDLLRRPWLVRGVLLSMFMGLLSVGVSAQVVAEAPEAEAAPGLPGADSVADQIDLAELGAEAALVLHYHRPDGDYENWNAWVWTDNGEGKAYDFNHEDGFGRYALVPAERVPERYGFLIRRGEWEMKDIDRDRFVGNAKGNVTEVWVTSGDAEVYHDSEKVDLAPKLTAAFLDRLDRLTVTSTTPLKSRALRDAQLVTAHGELAVKSFERSDEQAQGRLVYDVELKQAITPAMLTGPMRLEATGYDAVPVFARDALDDPSLLALDAELGPQTTVEATTFRTWSPIASSVDLLLYEDGVNTEPTRTLALQNDADANVWHVTVEGDLHGTAYQYRFESYGQERTVADVHCFAAWPGSKFSVVVDLDRTDPEGFDDHVVPVLKSPTDEVVYEIHVRDFTMTCPHTPEGIKGKYPGLVTPGEIEPGEDGVATGLAHLKQLGVTAVHLLPIHDFGNERHNYNWGYWTSLFNVPESDYSTTPDDPAATIRELKQTIRTLHDNDIRVILDVVYNHTSSSYEVSPFDQAVPWYYFRTTPDGALRNDAGVGNSVADERAMVRKYIIDSLIFWADEYKVDGFRFDLLGTHQPETVKELVRELRSRRPDLTIYGEPWTGGGPTYFPKGAQKALGLAVFNDHLRNAIRGDLDGKATGFANGPGGDIEAIRNGIAGAIDDFAADPTESINYVSAHDNRTLWDKLEYTLPHATEDEKRAMHKLSLGVVLTSQGIPFLHGGVDMARTKGGHHNSYNQGDEVNAFGWDRKAEYRDVFEYTAGLVALRRAHPAFRLTTAKQVRKHLSFFDQDDMPEGVVAYTLDGRAVGDAWDTIFVAYNGGPDARTVDLPSGEWNVVVDAEHAGNATLGTANGEVTLPPYSMTVMHR
ncbi:MAG: type I pullulanase [Planctomycetota bacterium]